MAGSSPDVGLKHLFTLESSDSSEVVPVKRLEATPTKLRRNDWMTLRTGSWLKETESARSFSQCFWVHADLATPLYFSAMINSRVLAPAYSIDVPSQRERHA